MARQSEWRLRHAQQAVSRAEIQFNSNSCLIFSLSLALPPSFVSTKPKGIKDIDTNFAEIPWQAMIARESNKKLLCGGAIVGDDIILTSAKCVAE